jgi:hypothetical protein
METKITSDYLSLLKQLLIFSLLLVSVAVALFFLLPAKYITPALFFLFPFFLSVTLISVNILIRSARKKFIRYLNVYMLTTLVKLILYIAVMVVYILLNKRDIIPFSISFLILYLFYTIFEVVWLVKYFKVPASE